MKTNKKIKISSFQSSNKSISLEHKISSEDVSIDKKQFYTETKEINVFLKLMLGSSKI